ncbi:MAG: 3-isopropylmalate dehydratase small subunit [Clostridia bacterium]|nr:3-isopropylmalate dehydratase small subunit [Clostridia bacterium]
MKAKGTVFKYADNVDTDVIIPARYLNTQDAQELAKHCMEDIDTSFVGRVRAGDVMVAGWNFGCGSSREHAPLVIKTTGIECVIAKSFARIFYRNAINIGLPILECEAASDAIAEGDTVSVNFDTGEICDETTGQTFKAQPYPEFLQNIIAAGGLMNSIKEKMEAEKAEEAEETSAPPEPAEEHQCEPASAEECCEGPAECCPESAEKCCEDPAKCCPESAEPAKKPASDPGVWKVPASVEGSAWMTEGTKAKDE